MCWGRNRAPTLKFGEVLGEVALTLVKVKMQLPWEPRSRVHQCEKLRISFVIRTMALWEEACDSEMKMNWGLGQGIKSYWRHYELVERWAVRHEVGYSWGGTSN